MPQATVLASDDDRSETTWQREECSRDVVSLQDRPEVANASDVVDDIHIIIKDQHDLEKAVKADDADVPVCLWDNRIMRREALAREGMAITTLRRFALAKYRLRLLRDCMRDLNARHGEAWISGGKGKVAEEAKLEGKAMQEIVWRASNNNWFEYPSGSRLHFFRFPTKYRTLARRGPKFLCPTWACTATSPTYTDPRGHDSSAR